MPFKIIRNDITKMQVDAIVNTANAEPVYSCGLDTAVYEAAGAEQLLAARRRIGRMEEGEAAITKGFALSAKYIIHAVSPVYYDGTRGEADKLRACYANSLALAKKHHCKSIAFPLIATGSFGYPKDEGLELALQVIHNFLLENQMVVYLVLFDKESVRLSGQIFEEIESFIDENYVDEKTQREYGFRTFQSESRSVGLWEDRKGCEEENKVEAAVRLEKMSNVSTPKLQLSVCSDMQAVAVRDSATKKERKLENLVLQIGETFQERLLRLIDEKGFTDVQAYKKAGKDKKLFHKIRSNKNYQPSKHTVFAFALALELSLDETKDLLASAGFAFSPSSRFDLIVQYVIEQGLYDLYKIDCILYDFGEAQYFTCEF